MPIPTSMFIPTRGRYFFTGTWLEIYPSTVTGLHVEIQSATANTTASSKWSSVILPPTSAGIWRYAVPISNSTKTFYFRARYPAQSGYSAGPFTRVLSRKPDALPDIHRPRRSDDLSISTPYNVQGSFLPVTADVSILSYADDSGPGPTTGWLAWTWSAFNLQRPDTTVLAVTANTTMFSDPPTPSLSQVAGGALGARTYYVKICYRKDSHYIGISAEASLAVSANNLLKVTAPASVVNMDGWTVLIGTSTGNNFDQGFAGSFGTDFTEPTGGATTSGSTKGSTSWSKAIVDVGLSASTAYWWWPYYDMIQSLIRMNFANTGQNATNAKIAQQDSHVPLSSAGITVTTPAANNTSSGVKGAGLRL